MSKELRYFKLGKKAQGGSFSDANSGLLIRGDETVSIDGGNVQLGNKAVTEALTSGHIVEVDAKDAGKDVTSLPIVVPAPSTADAKAKKEAQKKLTAKDLAEEEEEDEEEEEEDDDDDEEEDEDDKNTPPALKKPKGAKGAKGKGKK